MSRQQKLNPKKALEIRNSKELPKVLAMDYGVHISMIYRIKNNEYWKNA